MFCTACVISEAGQSSYLTYTPAADLIGSASIPRSLLCLLPGDYVYYVVRGQTISQTILPVLHSLVKLSTSATSTPAFTHCIPLSLNSLLLCIAVRRHLGHNARTVTSSHSVDRVSLLECFKLKLCPDLTKSTFKPHYNE